MEIISRLLNKIFIESVRDEIHETYPQKAAKLAWDDLRSNKELKEGYGFPYATEEPPDGCPE
jgi:hypothetical protein